MVIQTERSCKQIFLCGAGTLSAMGVSACVAMLSRMVLTRALGPSDLGRYTLAILVPALAVVVAGFGMSTASIYLIGSKQFKVGAVESTFLTASAAMALLCVAVCVLVPGVLPKALLQSERSTLFAVCMAVPAALLTSTGLALLQAHKLIGRYNYASTATPLVTAAVFVTLHVAGALSFSSALLSWAICSYAPAIMALGWLVTVAELRVELRTDVLFAALRLAPRAYIANLAGFLVRRCDVILVSLLCGTVELGYYSVAFTTAELVWYLATAVTTSLAPAVARCSAGEATATTATVCRNIVFLVAFVLLCLLSVDRLLITGVFGRPFLPAVAPFRWLLPGILAATVDKVISADLIGRGSLTITMVTSIVTLLTNLAANLVLIPRLGISGAALASSLSYGVSAAIVFLFYVRLTGLPLSAALIVQRDDFRMWKTGIGGVLGMRNRSAEHI
jgi:O-antigen/teichoic acid export membrane protein